MEIEFIDGKIIVSYEIDNITAEFEEDISNVIGVVRCTGVSINSDAPYEINSVAENILYNAFASEEYNDAEGNGEYKEEACEDFSNRTGVDTSKIQIE